jgi:hypothetical protein
MDAAIVQYNRRNPAWSAGIFSALGAADQNLQKRKSVAVLEASAPSQAP